MPDWKFDVDEVGPEAEVDRSIEPESPSMENVAFVLLGVLTTVFLFARLVMTAAGG